MIGSLRDWVLAWAGIDGLLRNQGMAYTGISGRFDENMQSSESKAVSVTVDSSSKAFKLPLRRYRHKPALFLLKFSTEQKQANYTESKRYQRHLP